VEGSNEGHAAGKGIEMDAFQRFALYALAEGDLHREASRWLGWDSRSGERLDQPHIEGLAGDAKQITQTPRKYGFHGTIKPPFCLAEGKTVTELEDACARILPALPAVTVPSMVVRRIGGFVALVPEEPSAALADLAAEIVKRFDDFRAAPSAEELARRRASGLSPSQESNLKAWGYPYVMEDFSFHMTLSGRLEEREADRLVEQLQVHLAPFVPKPFPITTISLLGEDRAGMFHEVRPYALAG
jgi:putative phosphonate metabolism protein